MERLNGMDAGFIYAETPSWHMHVGALFVLDPSTAPERFEVGRLRALVGSRIGGLGPFRRRLLKVPLGLGRPMWVGDASIDLGRHIRRVGVPPPGGLRELARLVGDLFEYKLDHDRPLWEMWLIEGLEDDKVGLLIKAHHALVDGARGARLYETLLDLAPDAEFNRPDSTAPSVEHAPSSLNMLIGSLPWLASTPLRAAWAAQHLIRSTINMMRFQRSPEWTTATFPFQAPRTSINRRITPHRAFAFCSVDLAGVKEIKNAYSVTVNDVVLAICAGALRGYLQDRHELPCKPLVAQLPVAVQPGDATDTGERAWGNQVMAISASLATDLDDPVERLRAIHGSTRSAKVMVKAFGDTLILELAGILPPGIVGAGVHAYARLGLAERHPPIFNLIVSNVKGPPIPLYVAGARLMANYPIGPLLDGGGLNITVISYVDHVDFGFAVCPEIVEDPWLLADATTMAFAELQKAAKGSSSRPKARKMTA